MMDKEELFLKKRLAELARNCEFRHRPTHRVFLNLYEQTVFRSMTDTFSGVQWKLDGGYDEAERRVVCFLPFSCEEEDVLDYLRIEPSNEKFAQNLSHRDYLGALMNLGLERHMMGDIVVDGFVAHIIVLASVSEVILQNLEFVAKTKVKVSKEEREEIARSQKREVKSINVASQRLDVLIAGAFHLSRNAVSEYLMAQKVFVNAKMTTNHSYIVQEKDLISVRGMGRFRYLGDAHITRKGRMSVQIECF